MSFSPKTVGLVYNVKANLNIRYFTHSQMAVKKQKSSVQVTETSNGEDWPRRARGEWGQ